MNKMTFDKLKQIICSECLNSYSSNPDQFLDGNVYIKNIGSETDDLELNSIMLQLDKFNLVQSIKNTNFKLNEIYCSSVWYFELHDVYIQFFGHCKNHNERIKFVCDDIFEVKPYINDKNDIFYAKINF